MSGGTKLLKDNFGLDTPEAMAIFYDFYRINSAAIEKQNALSAKGKAFFASAPTPPLANNNNNASSLSMLGTKGTTPIFASLQVLYQPYLFFSPMNQLGEKTTYLMPSGLSSSVYSGKQPSELVNRPLIVKKTTYRDLLNAIRTAPCKLEQSEFISWSIHQLYERMEASFNSIINFFPPNPLQTSSLIN